MKKILIAIAVIISLLIWIAAGTLGKNVAKSKSSNPSNGNNIFNPKGFKKAAHELNDNAPRMLDKSLRFDKAEVDIPAISITYHHTYVNLAPNKANFKFVKQRLPMVMKYACNEKDMRWAMSHGASYIYVYRDNQGNEIARAIFAETDCKYMNTEY